MCELITAANCQGLEEYFGVRDLTHDQGGAGFVKTQNNLRETEIVFYRGSGIH